MDTCKHCGLKPQNEYIRIEGRLVCNECALKCGVCREQLDDETRRKMRVCQFCDHEDHYENRCIQPTTVAGVQGEVPCGCYPYPPELAVDLTGATRQDIQVIRPKQDSLLVGKQEEVRYLEGQLRARIKQLQDGLTRTQYWLDEFQASTAEANIEVLKLQSILQARNPPKPFDAEKAQARAKAAREKWQNILVTHYKGGSYEVTEVSVDEANGDVLITYLSRAKLYSWTRTIENFEEEAEPGVPRFVKAKEG